MIFAVWCTIWIVIAGSVHELIFPMLAILIRSAYHRDLTLVTAPSIVLSILVFMSYCFTQPMQEAILRATQMFALSCLMTHLLSVFDGFYLPGLPLSLARHVHQLPRCINIVKERFLDMRYTVSTRISHARLNVYEQINLYLSAGVNLFVEFVRVNSQLDFIVNARGTFPHPKEFTTSSGVPYKTMIGDVAIFAIAILFSLGDNGLVPKVIITGLRHLI